MTYTRQSVILQLPKSNKRAERNNMGNRAVITTKDKKIGVYLHWNGGYDSVRAFTTYCKIAGHRPPEQDSYGWARLCQVIGNFFGGTSSIGLSNYEELDCDNGDNGVYIIKNWEIVGREYYKGDEQDEYDLLGMLIEINNHQPQDIRLPEKDITEYLKSNGIEAPIT
jgi:hypothetical protein